MPYQKINLDIAAVILDDDEDLLYLIERELKGNKMLNYKLFHNPDEFLEKLTDEIRVVVLDYRLPHGKTGLEIAKEVKRANRENFVIGYSLIQDPKVLIEYINSDVDRFADKGRPDHLEVLVKYIKEGLVEAEKRSAFYHYFQTQLNKQADQGGGVE